MNEAAAQEHLQTIRTLMERAALYRRALAPTMLVAGILGLVAAVGGYFMLPETTNQFLSLWLPAAFLILAASFLIVRRQAIQAAEPFWTLPTRRVVLAALPAAFVGVVATWLLAQLPGDDRAVALALPAVWLLAHGLALHAAGFFMPRGIRWFGWGFVFAGSALGGAIVLLPHQSISVRHAHLMMGATFGLGHLAYGLYLRVTERKYVA